jgi:hypothetical protein
MKQPVFRFQEAVLSDAPLPVLRTRLGAAETLVALRGCRGLRPLEVDGEQLTLRWQRVRLGSVEEGTIRVQPHERGVHLELQGRLKGWGAFLVVGWVRWRTDRLLDRLIQEI